MLVTKIELVGHVNNHPDRTITEIRSFPQGISEDEADIIIDKFANAFTLISIKTVPDTYVHVPYGSTPAAQFAGTAFFNRAVSA